MILTGKKNHSKHNFHSKCKLSFLTWLSSSSLESLVCTNSYFSLFMLYLVFIHTKFDHCDTHSCKSLNSLQFLIVPFSSSWPFLFIRKWAVVSPANAATSTILISFPFQTTNQLGKCETTPMNPDKPSLPSNHDERILLLISSEEVLGPLYFCSSPPK